MMFKGQLLICIVLLGCVYCCDIFDVMYFVNFYQFECFYVDKNVIVCDLKVLFDYIFILFFGKDIKICFCMYYFGYIEFSFEVDLSVKYFFKVNKEWIEIGGCGMVDFIVFEGVGYDLLIWSGYVFGMGFECFVMFMYGIDDICYFY